MDDKLLLKKAIEATKYAYVPYSNFAVGAAILMDDESVILGCNIENASFGLTNCAERTALFKAISNGYSKEQIKKIAVVAKSKNIISPCGACRQVLIELVSKNCPVLLSNLTLTEFKKTTVTELLPFAFETVA